MTVHSMNYKFQIDLSDVKLILTPVGYYLKRTNPKYQVWKIPASDDVQVDKQGDIVEITLPEKMYKKNRLYRFDRNVNIK